MAINFLNKKWFGDHEWEGNNNLQKKQLILIATWNSLSSSDLRILYITKKKKYVESISFHIFKMFIRGSQHAYNHFAQGTLSCLS